MLTQGFVSAACACCWKATPPPCRQLNQLAHHEVPAMRQNPIAMIEFVAFIGFVIWLFFWQHIV